MKTKILAILLFSVAMALTGLTGCKTASQHSNELHDANGDELTVGVVQKEIKVGMAGADVAAALGSPNIVTRDSEGHESWVYDKIASEVSYSEGSTGIFLILAGVNRRSGASKTTQKTLTVIIKFDQDSKVKTFSYHATKF